MYARRKFIKNMAMAGVGAGLIQSSLYPGDHTRNLPEKDLVLGVVGLSPHSAAFSTLVNDPEKGHDLSGCRIAKLYHPPGNPDVEFTPDQLANYKRDVEKAGVIIVSSMEEMLEGVDGVLIETNDGRPHMNEVLPAIKAGKPVFVDKPVAENLEGVVAIYNMAEKHRVPIFSSSSLRYGTIPKEINQSRKPEVLGATTFSPASLEPSHTDLYWYGIHGVEMLYTVMGTGCLEVQQISHSEDGDVVSGIWDNGRVGTFRGIRQGQRGFGGRVFLQDAILDLGGFEGYRPLVVQIVEFFKTGHPPVSNRETLEIYAFMTAAFLSKQNGGQKVDISSLLKEFHIK